MHCISLLKRHLESQKNTVINLLQPDALNSQPVSHSMDRPTLFCKQDQVSVAHANSHRAPTQRDFFSKPIAGELWSEHRLKDKTRCW